MLEMRHVSIHLQKTRKCEMLSGISMFSNATFTVMIILHVPYIELMLS